MKRRYWPHSLMASSEKTSDPTPPFGTRTLTYADYTARAQQTSFEDAIPDNTFAFLCEHPHEATHWANNTAFSEQRHVNRFREAVNAAWDSRLFSAVGATKAPLTRSSVNWFASAQCNGTAQLGILIGPTNTSNELLGRELGVEIVRIPKQKEAMYA